MSVVGIPDSIDLLSAVQAIVKDDSGKLASVDYQSAITSALNTYAKHKPLTAVLDISGNGGHDYDLPGDWVDGISAIVSIEYPVGSVPAQLLDGDEYLLYQAPAGLQIRLLNTAPPAAATFRLAYTIPRTENVVLTADLDAVAYLAAANALDMLANAWLQSTDSTISADVVNYRSKSAEAASRAKAVRKLYFSHLNITEDQPVQPVAHIESFEQNYPGGADRLTHSRWARRRR